MAKKFFELNASEQAQFNSLVGFMKDTRNEDMEVKLSVIKKFDLDIKDPIIFDFLTNVSTLNTQQDFISDVKNIAVLEPTLPLSVDNPTKKAMTYSNNMNWIIVQNRLLHAISHLSLNERRLILFLSPIVRKEVFLNKTTKRFTVQAREFADAYGLKTNNVYKTLADTADTILEKAFRFWNFKDNNPFGEKTYQTGLSWVTKCEYLKNQGEIVVDLHEDVIEMLTIFDEATGNYWTKYQKEWVINLGTYGIIMLEMVLSSLGSKGYYTVEHLREKFDCVDNYLVFGDFRRYIIDKAIKEIQKHTPIKITYEQHKIGRNVQGLTFSYTDTSIKNLANEPKKEDTPKENNPFVNFKMTAKQLSFFAGKIAKVTGQDVETVANELSNVHLQGNHLERLKLLDFVPSDWFSEEEITLQPTVEQLAQISQNSEKQQIKNAELQQLQYEQDFQKILFFAEEFVLANQHLLNQSNIEGVLFREKNYGGIVQMWRDYLLDEKKRQGFRLLHEILAR